MTNTENLIQARAIAPRFAAVLIECADQDPSGRFVWPMPSATREIVVVLRDALVSLGATVITTNEEGVATLTVCP